MEKHCGGAHRRAHKQRFTAPASFLNRRAEADLLYRSRRRTAVTVVPLPSALWMSTRPP